MAYMYLLVTREQRTIASTENGKRKGKANLKAKVKAKTSCDLYIISKGYWVKANATKR